MPKKMPLNFPKKHTHKNPNRQEKITVSHWGTYKAVVEDGQLVSMRGLETDPDPSSIAEGMIDTLSAPCRIPQPMVRRGFLEKGPQADCHARGAEPFVAISWAEAEQLVADELTRIRETYGNEAIFAGSYGWASAGRFHHAQSQLHRFLKLFGGYTRSVNTYSYGSGEVILPHIIGDLPGLLRSGMTTWPVIIEHTELMVCFGGLPLKNGQIGNGGPGRHVQRAYMQAARGKGIQFVGISPIRDDMGDFLHAQWLAPVPGTDVALMLGLAHTLVSENLYDRTFLKTHCTGFDRFLPYLMGKTDGQPKQAEWAAAITGLDAGDIRHLARRMAGHRTMISVSWSLTRQEHGEQNYWMATTLAAMLGQIGRPGGGIGYGYCAENAIGNHSGYAPWAALRQRVNNVKAFIPVARISDMLLNPGGAFEYNGTAYTYPDIHLVYWAGGNPFHHHQDLNRMRRAWRKPETIIVHEPWWNASAKHADIVLPCTTTLERNDLSCNPLDSYAYPMEQVVAPFKQARHDYDIFAGIARRLGFEETFTEGRDEAAWLRYLYESSVGRGKKMGINLPPFEIFCEEGGYETPITKKPTVMLEDFRQNPEGHALKTPSGKIEIFSETIDGFGYDDCPGHPLWIEPVEWLHGERARMYPLHLLSNQPKTKLHSQLDHGAWSRKHKIQAREPVRMHPDDAAARSLSEGDIVRLYNDRGACLAGVLLSEALRPSTIQMSTGAWFDPVEVGPSGSLCKHGNVNVLTRDKGTSRLAQGCSAHACLVEVERYEGDLPEVTAFQAPEVVER